MEPARGAAQPHRVAPPADGRADLDVAPIPRRCTLAEGPSLCVLRASACCVCGRVC